MPPTEEVTFGKPEVRVSDDDGYELGVEVNGHWVSFSRIQGEQVRANVANAQAQADEAAAGDQT